MKPERGHAQLRKGRYSKPHASYFLTICTHERRMGLACDALFENVLKINIQMDAEDAWFLRVLTLMPDHLHAVIRLGSQEKLSGSIRKFKGRSSVGLRNRDLRWQPGGIFERQIRPDEPILPVFLYIFLNPYRKGLIEGTEKWPYFHCCEEDWTWFGGMTNKECPYPEWLT